MTSPTVSTIYSIKYFSQFNFIISVEHYSNEPLRCYHPTKYEQTFERKIILLKLKKTLADYLVY